MITPSQGAERHQLVRWSTPRLLRYFNSRRARLHAFQSCHTLCGCPECTCGYEYTKNERHTVDAMCAELDFIREILKNRPHVA
jgi:hypothetical protein